MTSQDADLTLTSRGRLLTAGKTLFSLNGYEATSTAAIAREAGSSESQLIRYFGGKAGLLEAIFNESWNPLNETIEQHIKAAEHGRDAILRILSLVIDAFSLDHDIAFLFLFEGRRMRGTTHEIVISKGFQNFWELLGTLIRRGQEDGSFRKDVDPMVLGSAMLGAAEGMIRDRILAERTGGRNPFDDAAIKATFATMVNALT
ncbi:MAG TPA: TetR/AcrR family transcriptional regulator [Thermoanaerobaculia bacterium]|nr:TetR/AcrR family transcriptional regulator [Thermoanaerobaculia bacterium]